MTCTRYRDTTPNRTFQYKISPLPHPELSVSTRPWYTANRTLELYYATRTARASWCAEETLSLPSMLFCGTIFSPSCAIIRLFLCLRGFLAVSPAWCACVCCFCILFG